MNLLIIITKAQTDVYMIRKQNLITPPYCQLPAISTSYLSVTVIILPTMVSTQAGKIILKLSSSINQGIIIDSIFLKSIPMVIAYKGYRFHNNIIVGRK